MKVTIYTTPDCVQCDSTKRMLQRNNIEFESVDLHSDPMALEFVRGLGYTQAPVVVVGDRHWSGFRMEKIKNLIAECDLERKEK